MQLTVQTGWLQTHRQHINSNAFPMEKKTKKVTTHLCVQTHTMSLGVSYLNKLKINITTTRLTKPPITTKYTNTVQMVLLMTKATSLPAL